MLANDPRLGDTGSLSIIKALTLSEYTVTGLPAAAKHKNRLVKVTNGAAGSPCLAISDGTNWKVLAAVGSTVSAT